MYTLDYRLSIKINDDIVILFNIKFRSRKRMTSDRQMTDNWQVRDHAMENIKEREAVLYLQLGKKEFDAVTVETTKRYLWQHYTTNIVNSEYLSCQ